MFVANKTDKEQILESWSGILSPEKLAALQTSKGFKFYELVFRHIQETDFRCLYSSKYSAPNSPVNRLVSAIVICEQRNWSDKELESQLSFNIEIRIALGLPDLDGMPFSMRTYYNFKNRLANYEHITGINLLEQVFIHLTKQQLAALNLNASIQRGDSVLLESSISGYSRISLLVEMLRRLYSILSPTDQQAYRMLFQPYLKGGEKFVYDLTPSDKEGQLSALGTVYYSLHRLLAGSYEQHIVFQTFARVYQEHFEERLTDSTNEEQAPIVVEVRTGNLGSNTLQSPDDLEATYRSKRKESHHGFVAFGAETCHPDNEINLVTALSVDTNNTDDSTLLEDKLDDMVELTPELDELHLDGGFGSKAIDEKAEAEEIKIIQTAVRGRKAAVSISIQGDEKQGFTATCPNPAQQPVAATKAVKNYKASFALNVCSTCPFRDNCPAFKNQSVKKEVATFYFSPEIVLMQQRHQALQTIPKERQTLRSGVEGLMGQLHRGAIHTGKLKVTGLFNTKLYVFAMGIAINFERIYNWLSSKRTGFSLFSILFSFFPFICSLPAPQRTKIRAQNNYTMSMNIFLFSLFQ